ncbi:MAG: hypothetical protein U9R04_03520 [Chloroflexota bacterium]|nr:hypothetical protein [Chloroflexota bacterium]
MSNYNKDLSDSAHDFIHIVCPKLREVGFLSGQVIPVEAVTADDMRRYLDMLAGIDLWVIEEKMGITGLASRIQWGPSAYDSFTIRETRHTGVETELSKRLRAIHSGGRYLYPYWSCQAYVTKRPTRENGYLKSQGEVLSVGVASTKDICTLIIHGQYKRRLNPDGNTFAAVFWEAMKRDGYELYTWPN